MGWRALSRDPGLWVLFSLFCEVSSHRLGGAVVARWRQQRALRDQGFFLLIDPFRFRVGFKRKLRRDVDCGVYQEW
jgi:hypothetical protein